MARQPLEELLLSFLVLLLLCDNNPGFGCVERERQALLRFKQGLVDESGLVSSWGDHSRNCCSWRGVQCSHESGHVIRLHLQAPWSENSNGYQSLRGEISPSLLELEDLTHLDLSHNDFESRKMPAFLGSLSRLQYLNLSYAELTGSIPTQLGNLSNLLSLDLCHNDFNSRNLEWLSRLSSLRHLDLGYVDLSEAIHWSQAINELPSLIHLDLDDCALPPISPSLSSHGNSSVPLVFLDLSWNNLITSSIYPWLFNFSTTLVHLDLSFCSLNGSISDAFGSMSSLEYLDLAHNALDSEILNWIGDMGSLVYLDLSWNQLHGSIPSTLPGKVVSLTHLDLSWNQLHGSIPNTLPGKLVLLSHLDLSNNQLQGSIPDTLPRKMVLLSHLDLSVNQLQGSIPDTVGKMVLLSHLDLSVNQLIGSIPERVGKMVLLSHLDLSVNQLNGSIPDTVGKMVLLSHLDLSVNQLNGSIPDTVGKMVLLSHLDLSSNQLQGSIPDTVGNLVLLSHLDLSHNRLQGSIPNKIGKLVLLSHLDLSGNHMRGSIPDTVEKMVLLTHLDLSHNQLQGSIPDTFGKMILLSHLDFSDNQLNGSIPNTVGKMVSLVELSLSQNHLQGEIPKSFSSNLCKLQVLQLDSNNFTGQLAPDFLACANGTLETLFLSDNQLSGAVPHFIGFSSLSQLYLDLNHLNGSLPESIGQLANLVFLDIASNQLRGVVSEAHLSNLYYLSRLSLSHNSLTFNMSLEWVPPFQLHSLELASCKLGPHFPNWIRTEGSFAVLDISNSNISDVLPDWFWNGTSIFRSLDLSKNRIEGALPNLSSKFVYFADADMSSNRFVGSIPQLPPHLVRLDLSSNNLSGSISVLCTVGNNTEILQLDLSNNSLTGGLPDCWNQWESLVALNLGNNRFSGKIPSSFGSLRSIQTLNLRDNVLTGELPSSLKNCTSLRFIDLAKNRLSGKIPEWIGRSLSNLTVFNIGSNGFSGSICPELCHLKNIQILDVSGNNISGAIPTCIGNFTAMTKKGSLVIAHNYSFGHFNGFDDKVGYGNVSKTDSYIDEAWVKWKGREFEYKNTLGLVKSIDLSSNMLSGEIPKEVVKLLELVSLNLSRNNLTGLIPTRIGQLKALEVLDLSQNRLFGEIPRSLVEISGLSVLNLSSNNLSGEIPHGTQLQSFNIDSYRGNPTLCGLPLRKCHEDKIEQDSPPHSNEDEIRRDGKDMWLYLSIAFGFIVGFWGVCGTLLLKNSWRYGYFRFLNKTKDWLYVIIAINMARLQRSIRR